MPLGEIPAAVDDVIASIEPRTAREKDLIRVVRMLVNRVQALIADMQQVETITGVAKTKIQTLEGKVATLETQMATAITALQTHTNQIQSLNTRVTALENA